MSDPAELTSRTVSWTARVREACRRYEAEPANPAAIAAMRQLRAAIARAWVTAGAKVDGAMAARDSQDSMPLNYLPLRALYRGDLGAAHRLMLASGLRYEGLTDDDRALLGPLRAAIAGGLDRRGALPALLGAMLYWRADELGLRYRGAVLPVWFVRPFLEYLLEFPCFFRERGEVERYAEFAIALIDDLHDGIVGRPDSPEWREIASIVVNVSNLVPLYFVDRNLLPTFRKRANILQHALRSLGYVLDWQFEPRQLATASSEGRSGDRRTGKTRLGVLKAHYLPHPETFTTFPVFEFLDRDRFEVVHYLTEPQPDLLDDYLARQRARCADRSQHDRVVPLAGNLAEQARAIREDDLDLLWVATIVTNSLHRVLMLAAHRLARVQFHSVSSPVTTGLQHADYYLSGTLTEVPDAQQHYSERLLLVDGPAHCFDYSYDKVPARVALNRSALGLGSQSIVYASGANLYKAIPEVREVWADILAAVPNSVLLLFPFGASWKRAYPKLPFWHSLREALVRRGVDPGRAIVLDALPSRADVRVCLQLADVYLDAFPYGGANSITDALDAGLPTVTAESDSFRSRQGAALLRSVGLDDLVTRNPAQYFDLAVRFGNDPSFRLAIADRVRQGMAPIPPFADTRAYAERVGTLFERAIADWDSDRQKSSKDFFSL